MILLYRASNPREAALLVQALAARGIECTQAGGSSSGGFGELGVEALQVDLHVREDQAAEAKRIIEEEQARPRADATEWTCASCNETSEPGFDLCWNCQTPRPE